MTDKIKENIDNSYLLGCIKHKNSFSFYLMPIGYWILNHHKYNPSYNPNDWEFVFRDNILNVTDENLDDFIQSIDVDKMDLLSLDFQEYNWTDIFLFFIDFDSKIFISYFDDIAVEEYLPDESWVGKFDNPINYLPENLMIYFS